MSTKAKKRLALIGAIASLVTAALVIPSLVDHAARLVDLIALFASGVTAGASITAAIGLKGKSNHGQ